MVWSVTEVLDHLVVTLEPVQPSVSASMPVKLRITVLNRNSKAFELPGHLMTRSAHVLFMEHEGDGLFVLTLASIFQSHAGLKIRPGQSASGTVTLDQTDLAQRTEVVHYEMPEGVRTFQVFMPLGAEEADGYRNMIGANSIGIDVGDSWAKP